MREAFVTLVDGDVYRSWYRRHVWPSHERLARAHGRPLVVLEGRVAAPSPVRHAHASWEKLRIFEDPRLQGYSRLCWLDADLYPMRGAECPFDLAERGWSAVDNNTYGDPHQQRLDAEWYWFLPEPARPPRLINTGLFVVERATHAPLMRAVWEQYAGQWDQGPFSYHLLSAEPATLAPASFNLLVLHHLARFGHGPRALEELVRRPAFVHFAGATTLRSGVYLEYVEAADRGDRAALRRLALRQLATWARWGAQRRLLALREGLERGLPTARRRRLQRALARCPRLLLSPHQALRRGWVAVDVHTSQFSAANSAKFGPTGAHATVALDEVLETVSGLETVELANVLERLPEEHRGATLARCAGALRAGGALHVSVAGAAEGIGCDIMRSTIDRRHHLGPAARAGLAEEARQAGLLPLEGSVWRPAPEVSRSSWRASWVRP